MFYEPFCDSCYSICFKTQCVVRTGVWVWHACFRVMPLNIHLSNQGSISSTFYVQQRKISVKLSVYFYAVGIRACKSCAYVERWWNWHLSSNESVATRLQEVIKIKATLFSLETKHLASATRPSQTLKNYEWSW
jgi:hypothetical protein